MGRMAHHRHSISFQPRTSQIRASLKNFVTCSRQCAISLIILAAVLLLCGIPIAVYGIHLGAPQCQHGCDPVVLHYSAIAALALGGLLMVSGTITCIVAVRHPSLSRDPYGFHIEPSEHQIEELVREAKDTSRIPISLPGITEPEDEPDDHMHHHHGRPIVSIEIPSIQDRRRSGEYIFAAMRRPSRNEASACPPFNYEDIPQPLMTIA